jgi:hypothetical protein
MDDLYSNSKCFSSQSMVRLTRIQCKVDINHYNKEHSKLFLSFSFIPLTYSLHTSKEFWAQNTLNSSEKSFFLFDKTNFYWKYALNTSLSPLFSRQISDEYKSWPKYYVSFFVKLWVQCCVTYFKHCKHHNHTQTTQPIFYSYF